MKEAMGGNAETPHKAKPPLVRFQFAKQSMTAQPLAHLLFLEPIPRRLRVFLPSLVGLVIATLFVCGFVVAKTMAFSWELGAFFLLVLAGPFASFWMAPVSVVFEATVGIICIGGMLAHPLVPNFWSAIITGSSFAVWFLLGMALACISV